MKAEDLLLTEAEKRDALIPDAVCCHEHGELALCRAQAAKVLAALAAYFGDAQIQRPDSYGDYVAQHLESIAASTGLTWPPKEG